MDKPHPQLLSFVRGRIGLFGGSFDPIHLGHLRKAEDAQQTLGLRRVLLVPTYVSPYKPNGPRASGEHRFHMVKLAVAGYEGLEASDVELRRDTVSYTVDTVEELTAAVGRPVLLVGADTYPTLPTWRWYQDLLRQADIVVFTRLGYDPPPPPEVFPAPTAWSNFGRGLWTHEEGLLAFLSTEDMEVSSTDVRRRAAARGPLDGLVTPEVADYIKRRHLYEATRSG